MEIVTGLDAVPEGGWPGCVITWGVFDGVHIAHRKILQETVRQAKLNGVRSAVATFDRHPEEVLHGRKVPLLTSLKRRLARLSECGIEICLILPFTEEFSRTSAEDFLRRIVGERIRAKGIVLGHDSRFGHDRIGDAALADRIGRELGIRVSCVERQLFRGRPVSSSLIRELLEEGNVREANRLLGHPHEVQARVVHGDHRGRELGFPTANLQLTEPLLLPASGVYAGRTLLDGREYLSVVNLGRRPTFGDGAHQDTLEVHLLDYAGEDFYDRTVELAFLFRIRDERRFRSARTLARQIRRDIRAAREGK